MVSAHDDLSVVIVNHRRHDLLARAIEALRASVRRPDQIVVVDVQPEPGSAPPEGDDLRLLVTEDNPGYAAACNRGAALASGAWLLFMNDDVFVEPTCLGGVLAAAAADPGIGIATCRLELPDGRLDHACHRGSPSVVDAVAYTTRLDRLFPRSRRLGHYRLTWLDPRAVHDVEACSGAFLLIRREVLESVGGWDEAYRFYAEDLDLCARVRAAGYRVRYVGTERAVHVKGASSYLKDTASDQLSASQLETRAASGAAVLQAHERFYERHMEARTARPLRPLVRAMFSLQRRRVPGRG